MLALLRADAKNVSRDLILMVSMLYPPLIVVLMRWGIPLAGEIIGARTGFLLGEHYLFIQSFFLTLTPMMFGVMVGFMVLDERDEGVLAYFSVTPLQKSGYLLFRTATPLALAFVSSWIILALANLTPLNFLYLVPVVTMAGLGGPLLALFLGSFAGNKVEGLALAKGLGVIFLAPVAGYLLPLPWHLLAGLFPPYWVSMAFLHSGRPDGAYWIYLLSGFAVHVVYLNWLLHRFSRRSA